MDILVHVTKFFDIAEYTGDAKNSGVLELGVNGNISEHWQVGAGVLLKWETRRMRKLRCL